MRQIISLWFPTFSTDRTSRGRRIASSTRAGGALADAIVTYQAVNGRLFVESVSASAAHDAFPGQPLAEARAALPDLRAVEADPAADRRLLADLADWCGRYSLLSAPAEITHGQAGIWLDVTDCAHLFGGPAALVGSLLNRLRGLGFTVRAALAPTPGAAWAFARYDDGASDGLVVTPLELRARLRHLPVAGLRLPPPLAEEMTRFGLGRIGDLYEFARAGLVAHFGPALVRRLDQALGRVVEPITPARPVAPLRSRLAFAEPIATVEAAGLALRSLLADLAATLEARSLGVRRLELAVYRADGAVRRLPTDIQPALREPDALHRLMAPHLDKLGLDAGVEIMVLSAAMVEPLVAEQPDLVRMDPQAFSAMPLTDREVVRSGFASAPSFTRSRMRRRPSLPAATPLQRNESPNLLSALVAQSR